MVQVKNIKNAEKDAKKSHKPRNSGLSRPIQNERDKHPVSILSRLGILQFLAPDYTQKNSLR